MTPNKQNPKNSKPVRQKHAETSAEPDAGPNTQKQDLHPTNEQLSKKPVNKTVQEAPGNRHQPRETTNQPTKQTYHANKQTHQQQVHYHEKTKRAFPLLFRLLLNGIFHAGVGTVHVQSLDCCCCGFHICNIPSKVNAPGSVSSIQNHLPLIDIWRKKQICFKLVFSPNPMIWSASSDNPDHPSIPTGWPKILPSSEAKGATVTGHCALKIKCKISYNWLLSFLFQ